MINRITIIGVLTILINTPFLCFTQDSTLLHIGDQYYQKASELWGKNSDSTLFYIELASETYLEGKFWSKYVLTLNAFASYYDVKNDFLKRKEYLNFAMMESEKYLDESDLHRALTLGNYSAYLKDIGDYEAVLKNFKEVLEIERANKAYEFVAGSLKNIGTTYDEIGDLDLAIKYYNECFNFEKEHPESLTVQNAIDVYLKRSKVYLKRNELGKASSDLTKAIKLLPKDKIDNSFVNNYLAIQVNYGFAEIHLMKNNSDSLKIFVNQAFIYCKNDFQYDKTFGYILLGKLHLKNENYEEAIDEFLNAKSDSDKRLADYTKHKEFSTIHELLANSYLNLGRYEKAILHFRKSIFNLSNKVKNPTDDIIPEVNDIFNPHAAMTAFNGIGTASYQLYKKSRKIKHLQESNQSFDVASSLISEVRKTYEEDNSLLRFSEEVLPIYESAIIAAVKMYEQVGEIEYLHKAFEINERSKSILLVESINKSSAIQLSDIPDSLLQKEKELNYQITALKKKIYEENNKIDGLNEFIVNQLEQQLFKDSEAYDELIRKFESSYPKYYNLKYNNSVATVDEIQNKLSGSQCQIIEYFVVDSDIYVFSISENQFDLHTIPRNIQFESDIDQVLSFLKTPPSSKNIIEELKQYTSLTKSVYDTYVRESIYPESNHLIFITDGPLGYLPFEALITEHQSTQNISFSLKNLSYLIEDFDISYSYSSTLLLNSFQASIAEAKTAFFGVAPSFGIYNGAKTRVCNDRALFSLQCSEDEVNSIRSKLGGNVLLGKEATLSNTRDRLSDARIIHFATHACLDDANPEFNKIYLSDDYLSNNDLYSLKLNSELAVLSACETGSGKLAKGEGVMSLARGFIHAGCPSIVMSLWSIDDCATSKIMVNFYDELSKGKTKPEALKRAKLKYIKKAKKANQHPYYWASFVQIGNFHPVDLTNKFPIHFLLIGFLFALILFIFLKKRSA